MNQNLISEKTKTEFFQNGIVIPKYILMDTELDSILKIVVSAFVHLSKDEFDGKDFIVSSDFLYSIGLDKVEDLNDWMDYLQDEAYIVLIKKFKRFDGISFKINIHEVYSEYIHFFESMDECPFTFLTYCNSEDFAEYIPDNCQLIDAVDYIVEEIGDGRDYISQFLEINNSDLQGDFVIPPFVLFDTNLDAGKKIHFSKYLLQHDSHMGEIEQKLYSCLHCHVFDDDYYDDLFDILHRWNYIILISKKIKNNIESYKLKIHPWYLQYINTYPFYTEYKDDYYTFLSKEILPSMKDKTIQDELANQIIEHFSNDDSTSDILSDL